ncbi:MAG: PGPGW domain-containing protein [Propionibacteriaceae bacterium]
MSRHSSRSMAAQMAADRLHHDRWTWRRKIRRSPRKLAFYRGIVGVIGTLFICLGFVTGPLPGPGGIPLVLLGLAIWASEFHWAHRVMVWFRHRLKQYQSWNRKQQVQFWAVFALCCWLLGYAYLVVIGPPGWVPAVVRNVLTVLPGV